MDYQNIIDNLTEDRVKQILNKLDIPFEDKGSFLLMQTFCHNHKDNEDASHKLYYYKNNKIFVCYTECQNMSIFKFLKNYYNAQQIEYDWYNDIYNLIVGDKQEEGFTIPKYKSLKDKYLKKREEIQLSKYSEGALDTFIKKYPPEWLNDGITREAMDKYGIRYSISQNKIIIPHRDVNGRLIGIRGRALSDWEIENIGKYTPVKIEQIWYKHPLGLNLYGLYENKENIKKSGVCYVFEAEKSVLQLENFNMLNCGVAVCGSQFNKYQLNLLLKYCQPQEIVICFDKEELKGEEKYFNKLYNLCKKYNNYCDFSFIYDRQNLLELKDSPSDKGEEIFKKLLEKRVRVK